MNGRLTIIFLNAPFAAGSYTIHRGSEWGNNVWSNELLDMLVTYPCTYIALAFPN